MFTEASELFPDTCFFCKMKPSTHGCQVCQAVFPLSAPPESLPKAACVPPLFYSHSFQLSTYNIAGPAHLPPSELGWANSGGQEVIAGGCTRKGLGKNFFSGREARYCYRLPKEVVESSFLEVFRKRGGIALCGMV